MDVLIRSTASHAAPSTHTRRLACSPNTSKAPKCCPKMVNLVSPVVAKRPRGYTGSGKGLCGFFAYSAIVFCTSCEIDDDAVIELLKALVKKRTQILIRG